MLFSHETIRPSQKELMATVRKAVREGKSVLAHAPTGLGKTAAALCPALEFAAENDMTVFFLTSRHTQHKIVLDTVRKINERNKTNFAAANLIGKRLMCGQDVEGVPSSDFAEYCKSLVENDQCEFYLNARGTNNLPGTRVVAELKAAGPVPAEKVFARCVQEKVCPYEASLMIAEKAKVVVADYYYVFHPYIREMLFGKLKKRLDEAIVIVDEAHNLPARMRDLMTFRLSSRGVRLAVQEAKKHNLEVLSSLVEIQEVLNRMSERAKEERLVRKEEFVRLVERVKPFREVIAELGLAAEMVREEQKTSHIGSVAKFLEEWQQSGDGFARLVRKDDRGVTLVLRCLDPALMTKEVFDECQSVVVMSGTLQPTEMYADVLGVGKALQKSFASPFPEQNKLPLIVPRTTTKFSLRSERQFQEIGKVCAEIAEKIPGCIMLFFPSYFVRDAVAGYFVDKYERPVFFEKPGMNKEGRQRLLDEFAGQADVGAALLGVASGSFGEGVDLPGVVKGVIVAGLPLERPDLETTELIAYYDKKFGKGWEYGYILPAMTRCVQNAGRCIRSETDRGVLAFVDERYAWPRYKVCFPSEWNVSVTLDYEEEVARFFGRLA